MAETAIPALLEIMRDPSATLRDRLNAAVSASRVEKLQMPGEAPPESVRYLRGLIDDASVATNFRREAAAATAYFERRSKKAALTFDVADLDEKRRAWRGIINGSLRVHLKEHPRRNEVLLTATDTFEMPAIDPDVVLSALFGGNRQQRRRRLKAIDARVAGTWSGTEAERKELLRPLVQIVHARLVEFGLAK